MAENNPLERDHRLPTVGQVVPPLSGATAGLLGTAAARGEAVDLTDTQLENERELTGNDMQVMERRCRVIMFRDGQITELALMQWICPGVPANHYKYIHIMKKARELQYSLQARMWCNDTLVDKVCF